MSQHPYHQSLHLKNFTAFSTAEFEFSPGVNVLIGENGTGKTHVMKALYATQTRTRSSLAYVPALQGLFQIENSARLIRDVHPLPDAARVEGIHGDKHWSYAVSPSELPPVGKVQGTHPENMTRPVFIPALDMMGHTRGFTEAYEEVRLDFDTTCRDIVNLLRLERKRAESDNNSVNLEHVLGGTVELDQDGRFYLLTKQQRLPMPLVAEGLRKIATLSQLIKNGWLMPGTTLFWDEPEVNLNPGLMDEVVGAVLSLARSGVQIFLATHSYVILKELDLQTQPDDAVAFFSLEKSDNGTQVHRAERLGDLQPNAILDQYASLYDRELTRSTGRNRRGERVA